jgi:hypothetical protein
LSAGASILPFPTLTFSFFFSLSRGVDPSTWSSLWSLLTQQKIHLLVSRSAVWKSSRIFGRLSSHSEAASPILCLDPSHQCCLPDPGPSFSGFTCKFIPGLLLLSSLFSTDSSSWLEFLVLFHFCTVGHPYIGDSQSLPRSTIFLGLNNPEEVPFSPMPLLHSGTPSCRRTPTFSWIHDFPRSFPSSSGGAPRPDCRPYAASSVLRPESLQPLPWESPDAPLWTTSFVGWVQSLSLRCRWSLHFSHLWDPSTILQVWISFLPG